MPLLLICSHVSLLFLGSKVTVAEKDSQEPRRKKQGGLRNKMELAMSVIEPSFKASLEVRISGIPVVTSGRSWNHDLQGAEYRDREQKTHFCVTRGDGQRCHGHLIPPIPEPMNPSYEKSNTVYYFD